VHALPVETRKKRPGFSGRTFGQLFENFDTVFTGRMRGKVFHPFRSFFDFLIRVLILRRILVPFNRNVRAILVAILDLFIVVLVAVWLTSTSLICYV